ncbi:hypothetical protein ACIBG7_34415 [Nonomuraea sp. NPDC050328]|uniref:hypothetical protein n=1 Tax=Nonomuraea sp. NPDC050328 TaxID=3364361 RepID=UPI0037997528
MIGLDDGLLDREYVLPGSTVPVRLARLRLDGDGGSVSLVRFPPGWTRPGRGHYLAGEEFVVFEGELRVSGVGYLPGDWGWLPAGAPRFESATPLRGVGAGVLRRAAQVGGG